MYRGYIKLWRKIEDSQIFENEKALKIWIWFLLRANHQEKDVLIGRKIIKINQGEFMTSFPHLQEDLKFAMSTIHFWINKLEELGMIESKKTNKFTLIKIKNWTDYQDTESQKKANEITKRKLKETNKNVEYTIKNDKDIYSLALGINHWNERTAYPTTSATPRNTTAIKLLPKCRKENEELVKAWNKINPSQEDWELAVKNYIIEIANRDPNNDYANHRFSLFDFVKQKNGFIKFLNR